MAVHVLSKCVATVVSAHTCCLSEVSWGGVTCHKSCSDTAAVVSCCAAVWKAVGASLVFQLPLVEPVLALTSLLNELLCLF